MKDQIAVLLMTILEDMGLPDPGVTVDVPDDPSHGDYTTNVAMKIATSQKSRLRQDYGGQAKVKSGSLL